MFNSSLLSENIPLVQTRQALLLLDLQNDLASIYSKLPISTNSEFVENIKSLVPVFRQTGDVIWVRSEFEVERPINDGQGLADTVITDKDLPRASVLNSGEDVTIHPENLGSDVPGPVRPSKRAMELVEGIFAHQPSTNGEPDPEHDEVNETFLSVSRSGNPPSCCMPDTFGAKFIDDILPAIDHEKDTIVVKSHYSAFKSDSLLSSLRGKLVTELYICGSLSNISVYATAIDAARHGFSITILEDCLGYRDDARHQEAMRQMADMMGADGLTSTEFIEDYEREQQKKARREARSKGRLNGHTSRGIKKKRKPENGVRKESPGHSPNAVCDPYATESFPTLSNGSSASDEGHQAATITDRATEQEQSGAAVTQTQEDPPQPSTEKFNRSQAAIEVDTAGDDESRLLETALRSIRLQYRVSTRGQSSQGPGENHTHESTMNSRQRKPVKMRNIPMRESRPIVGRGNSILEPVPSLPRPPTPVSTLRDAVPASIGAAAASDTSDSSRPTSNESLTLPAAGNSSSVDQSSVKKEKRIKRAAVGLPAPTLGPSDIIGEGDSRILENFLPSPLADDMFERVKSELQWHTMSHRGGEVPRLVAVEGEVAPDASVPIYRHPADESPPLRPFSASVAEIRDEVQKVVKHPVNHALIQLYRDGKDNISEHSDKSLDIVPGSSIVNVSLGAQRTMTLRTKKSAYARAPSLAAQVSSSNPTMQQQRRPSTHRNFSSETQPRTRQRASPKRDRQTQRIPLPHNSIFILGQQTNMRWLHAIRADKRALPYKTESETAYAGERISITFRHIGTFVNDREDKIWGQGARNKEKAAAGNVSKSRQEAEECLVAFGTENHESIFDWEKVYGQGFDVVDMHPVQQKNKLVLAPQADSVEVSMVKLCLEKMGIEYDIVAETSPSTAEAIANTDLPPEPDVLSKGDTDITFTDTEAPDTLLKGALQILLYLDKFHTFPPSPNTDDCTTSFPRNHVSRATHANILSRAMRAISFHQLVRDNSLDDEAKKMMIEREFDTYNSWLVRLEGKGTQKFITGAHLSIADCAVWPVVERWLVGGDFGGKYIYDSHVSHQPDNKSNEGNELEKNHQQWSQLWEYCRMLEDQGWRLWR